MTSLPRTSENTLAKDTHIVRIAVELVLMDDSKLNAELIKFDSRKSLSGKSTAAELWALFKLAEYFIGYSIPLAL